MYKDDINYTTMRLQNTVVRDREAGELVHILNIGGGNRRFMAEVNPTNERGGYVRTVPLAQLDLSSPPLVNINHGGRVYYVARVPKRNDWRQGIRRENLSFVYEGRFCNYDLDSLDVLKAPVYDRYPTYKECLGKNSAFSRTFSLDREKKLWYKCREVVGRDVDGVPILDEEYEWLKEALDDSLEH